MPLYRKLDREAWDRKEAFFRDRFSPCSLCPRQCGALREDGEKGICLAGKNVRVASHNLHHGEEPAISGSRGSGTLFFSGCTLKCVFCQNFPISQLNNGENQTVPELSRFMLGLQKRGAHNINLVSPTPFLSHFVSALRLAAEKGLKIPVVLNSGGYEREEVIRELENIVDIYMPDFKYNSSALSKRYSGVDNYPETAFRAIAEMFRQTGPLQMDDDGIAVRGVIIRHLILPGHTENSIHVLRKIGSSTFRDSYLSLMSQFFPAYRASDEAGLGRRLSSAEYEKVKSVALEEGLTDGWFQDI